MTLSLTPELEATIQEQIDTGQFESAEAVISMGVGLIRRLNSEDVVWLAALKREVDEGLASVAMGRVKPIDINSAMSIARTIKSQQSLA